MYKQGLAKPKETFLEVRIGPQAHETKNEQLLNRVLLA